MRIADLALKIASENAPGRSQFYEWPKLTYCNRELPRGGWKQPKSYEQYHLNRLVQFAKFKDTFGSFQLAHDALMQEIERDPDRYGEMPTVVYFQEQEEESTDAPTNQSQGNRASQSEQRQHCATATAFDPMRLIAPIAECIAKGIQTITGLSI
jgi:hypothetical protein